MAAYNKVNGKLCSENRNLLTEVLRDEWGFKGFVVSDWGAVSERDEALSAGIDLEMPTSKGVGIKKIINAVSSGSLETLDAAVERILENQDIKEQEVPGLTHLNCIFRKEVAQSVRFKNAKLFNFIDDARIRIAI